jgi:hypothetical protein
VAVPAEEGDPVTAPGMEAVFVTLMNASGDMSTTGKGDPLARTREVPADTGGNPEIPANQVEHRVVPIETLHPHPDNAKGHDIPAIRASLARFGQYRTVVARPHPSIEGEWQLLAGHGTWEAAREEGWTHLAINPNNVGDDDATRIVLLDNRLPELGGYNDEALAALLGSLGGDYSLTGYTEEDYRNLVDDLRIEDEGPKEFEPKFTFDTPHSRGTRIIVLELPTGVFQWAQEQFQVVAERLGVVSNSDVIVRLLAKETETEPPEESEESEDDDG